MDPWYRVVSPRKEVREGRSFSPDEFAIALEQVVAGTAPDDYREPTEFFDRTCFTRALSEHLGMALRRLAGETADAAPVLTLVTQFGGGKTHTLTALYHLIRNHHEASSFAGVPGLLRSAHLTEVPKAQVGVFVGNAWDPRPGAETPWIDLAHQLAGEAGAAALGASAASAAPGTDAVARLFDAAGGSVLILFDEVLNFLNRHRAMADPFYAFLQNLTVATAGTSRCVAVVSLPRSQVEMTEWDQEWQERVTKIVRRVAKDLIANDEGEIAEVVRRRLFQDLGGDRKRRAVTQAYADWCFDRRAQLPPEWTAVDSATSEATGRELLWRRFEACYPFHPATLSVFQRKWQALPQYQQTRGTLAMLAQWIAWAYREGWHQARQEPLITLGSAPLEVPAFKSVIIGQLGEPRLLPAIDADIAGEYAHARTLDAEAGGAGPLKDIHRRVGTAILFESSGGQTDRAAHLPELRFALGEPDLDTTSIDNAALALEARAFFIQRVGTDGFRIHHRATLKKVMNDRRASLDEEDDVRPAIRALVRREFERGAPTQPLCFPEDGASVQDTPRLNVIVLDPQSEWSEAGALRGELSEWTMQRGSSPRLYPAALVWSAKKPGRQLHEKVEALLAWRRVEKDLQEGLLGADYERADRADVERQVREAEGDARDEVWASYRYVVLADRDAPDRLAAIDLGAGHASAGGSLYARVIAALRSQALLNEVVGAGYLERHWPEALRESGAWPLSGLRQSFLNGALTRLLDPDTVLRVKIVEFVGQGDFGLASGQRADGTYDRLWYRVPLAPDEVAFESDIFLLTRQRAAVLEAPPPQPSPGPDAGKPGALPGEAETPGGEARGRGGISSPGLTGESGATEDQPPPSQDRLVRLIGTLPPEAWNRVGTRLIPKLRAGSDLELSVELSARVDAAQVAGLEADLRLALEDLSLSDEIRLDVEE